jgi:uncharacterized damage-inducible protein DinB
MDLKYIDRLFSYNDWANREVARALSNLKELPSTSTRRLAHMVSAERLWLERLGEQKQTNPVWPEFSFKQCEKEIAELRKLWHDYLMSIGEDDLSRTVSYKNSKGEDWTSQTQDILMHVILHSAYHRGQIASDMRAGGSTPANTDFIHAVRQGIVE